ncbi:MAG: RluA family pseudouridine synthase [Deltaproteobacteria bacterium]|nr:RluA family pseudouridine synthase [Deltaproteobacteria bacterium]
MTAATPQVMFEDDHLLAIDKPAGLLAHADGADRSALLWAQARESARGRDPAQLHLVHRLDRDTSGVLLFARGRDTAEAVNALFRERKVLKMYLALCAPVPAVRWQRVSHQLRPQRVGSGERMTVVASDGAQADCEIEVLARGRRFALVRVIPDQGRKHQVRVALAATGSPIAGDFLYGGALSRQLAARVMLHARSLQFAHPVTGAHLELKAPVPAEFKAAIAADGAAVPGDLDVRHRTASATGPVRKRQPKLNVAHAGAAALPAPRTYARSAARKSPKS